MILATHILAMATLLLPGLAPEVPVPGGLRQGDASGRALEEAPWRQVRIEQRLIIRITPRVAGAGQELPPPPQVTVRLHERKIGKCLSVAGIRAVRPASPTRLLLFMRDHQMVGVDLARTCNARDFYMGFYMAPTSDGLLCVGRDTIHSRAGSTCTLLQIEELVPEN